MYYYYYSIPETDFGNRTVALCAIIIIEYKMGASVGSLFSNKAKTEELIVRRREAHKKRLKERLASDLKVIETNVLHDPVNPDRPYGLPEDMEGSRADIWDLIFQRVDSLDTIVALREVCDLFRDLLESKYVQAKLPQVIEHCLELNHIPHEDEPSSENNWARILSSLSTISRLTKSSVDSLLDRGMLGSDLWFSPESFHEHYYQIPWNKIPILILGTSAVMRRRLQKALNFLEVEGIEKCQVTTTRAVIFTESILPGGPVIDLPELRDEFQELLEKIGERIISFTYVARDSYSNVYTHLCRFVRLMPNLEELMVLFHGARPVPANHILQPFPHCKNLRRYAEGWDGFDFHYLQEIFKANPTIEGVQLCETPAMGSEVHGITALLDTLPVKSFHSTCFPLDFFIQHRFQWMKTLTTLALWDTSGDVAFTSSRNLFRFISNCESLRNLFVSSSSIRDTGGDLQNLHKLEIVYWKLLPKFQSLGFLQPVEGLRKLGLDVSACPKLHERGGFMKFLAEEEVLGLFPALRQIHFRTETNGRFEVVWRSGSAV